MDPRLKLMQEEEIYIPFFEQKIKSRKLLKEMKEKQGAAKFYGWSLKENYLYASYLRSMKEVVLHPTLRKEVQIFRRMAGLIKTRNIEQIKSHHQKMMLKHRELDRVVRHFEREVARVLSSSPHLAAEYSQLDECIAAFFEGEGPTINRIVQERMRVPTETPQKSVTCEESSEKRESEKECAWEVKIEEESQTIYLLSDCWRQREALMIFFEEGASS